MREINFTPLPVSDGSTMQAYISFPQERNASAAIILFQEAFGVNGHIRKVADRFALLGYTVIAPELFHRGGDHIEVSYSEFDKAKPFMAALNETDLTADIKACESWINAHADFPHEKMGSIGFCMGGRVSFLANTVLPLSAAVSYYGGGLDTVAHKAPWLHGAHLFLWGGQDQAIPAEKRNATLSEVEKAGKEHVSTVFSTAGHAFNSDERPSYHASAASEAWALTTAFFANRLK